MCYIPSTLTEDSDETSSKKTLVYRSNEVIKQYNLGGCSVDITNGSDIWSKP
jgi:hypothetical protein